MLAAWKDKLFSLTIKTTIITMEKAITLNEHFTNKVITKDLVDECKGEVLSKMKELNYNYTTRYSVAAIALFLDTLYREEIEEILNVLNLQEK